MVSVKDLQYSAGTKTILHGLTVDFAPGHFHMILGPNGSGKSTFLKLFSGELRPDKGSITYEGQSLAHFDKAELARRRAVLSQHSDLNFPLTVAEVVSMGRYPHFQFRPGAHDEAICRQAMERLQVAGLAERNYLTLSGGERQRVQFARVLAQIWEPPATGYRYLFLDEPLGHLDVAYQQAFLQLAVEWLQAPTVLIAVMHDINLAIQYADNLLFLKDGRLVAAGAPERIVTEGLLADVFEVRTQVVANPVSGKPLVLYEQNQLVIKS